MLNNPNFINLILGFLLSFSIAFFISPKLLLVLKKFHLGQSIRKEGPKAHLKKSGTPTMGGIVFLISILFTIFIINRYNLKQNIYFSLYVIFFFIVGFLDDYLKISRKENLGLNGKQKLLMQLVFSFVLASFTFYLNNKDTVLFVPFMGKVLDLKYFYIPFTMLTIIATTNGLNLTDGLDGLASSVTSIVMIAFSLIALNYNYISATVFSAAVSGACLGFLRINTYKAKCFMGDTGSMLLGGAVSAVAILMNMHLLIIIIGFVYVFESLSVIIQVAYFKRTGKRIFKMSPFHHHLELCGYHETKVVKVFCVATMIFSIIGIISTNFL